MSLFQRAGDLIRAMIQGSEEKLRPEIDAVVGELHFAHKAQTASMAEGEGMHITMDGSSDTGFMVSLHNGTLFRSFSIEAVDEVSALRDALDKFEDEVENNPVPQSAVAPSEPPDDDDDEKTPTGPGHPVERPFDGDPGTVDVTRGRVGDEAPDPAKDIIDDESVPPGVTEAAPEPGTHLGNDQALSYAAEEPEAEDPGEGVESSVEEHPHQAATQMGGDLPSAPDAEVGEVEPVHHHEEGAEHGDEAESSKHEGE